MFDSGTLNLFVAITLFVVVAVAGRDLLLRRGASAAVAQVAAGAAALLVAVGAPACHRVAGATAQDGLDGTRGGADSRSTPVHDNKEPSVSAKAWDKSRLPSRHTTMGPERAPHRSYYYAMGLTREEIEQPLVGVASCWNEAAPCNISLSRQAQAAKVGVKEAAPRRANSPPSRLPTASPWGTSR